MKNYTYFLEFKDSRKKISCELTDHRSVIQLAKIIKGIEEVEGPLRKIIDKKTDKTFKPFNSQYEKALVNWLKGLRGLHPKPAKKPVKKPVKKPASSESVAPKEQQEHLLVKEDECFIIKKGNDVVKIATALNEHPEVAVGWHENSAMIFWHPVLRVAIFSYHADILNDWLNKGYQFLGSIKNSITTQPREKDKDVERRSNIIWHDIKPSFAAQAAKLV